MTVADLIAELEQFDGELEVRIASQPGYPLEYKIAHVIDTESIVSDEDEDENSSSEELRHSPRLRAVRAVPEDNNVVYICEGSQVGYFTKRAWNR